MALVLNWVHLGSPVNRGSKVVSGEVGEVGDRGVSDVCAEVSGGEFFIGEMREGVETLVVASAEELVVAGDVLVGVGEDLESVGIFRGSDVDLVVNLPLVVDVFQSGLVDINGLGWLVSEEEEASSKSADNGKSNKEVLLHFL